MDLLQLQHENAGISEAAVQPSTEALIPYIEELKRASEDADFSLDEASVRLPFDEKIRTEVLKLAAQLQNPKLKYIVVLGIGGSNLGTQAIYEALHGRHTEFRPVRIFFGDTVSPRLATYLKKMLIEQTSAPEEFVLNVISKSGTTTETIAQFETLYEPLHQKYGDAANARIVTTTDRGSKLWKLAEKKGFKNLEIPKKVGGRFSVFSAVGLFPLHLVGINIVELLDGARAMAERCLESSKETAATNNPALASAILTHLHAQSDLTICNNFFFNPELESLGKWHRQLMGESIGKEKDLDGNIVHAGITPMVSIGSTDLHSMAQLYFGGPRDKFHHIIYSPTPNFTANVPKESPLENLVQGIGGKSFQEIMSAIIGGVKAAYVKNKIPFTEITMPEVREHTLGQYLQFKMIEMMFLARLMNLNAFDQPNVEDYKSETRALLA
ncbi:hypothetical protein COV82_05745 [Candidatus Peregrinibacteria bacterium CG11_big_fil_rev_8_21_14_0_20_46_8]|nr:MAG: hypothetical protein COV82_05745 [Candidatus Peregrinibacteria bacterium CG11_big_fil_rev_8_21_14_0_20_46_8]